MKKLILIAFTIIIASNPLSANTLKIGIEGKLFDEQSSISIFNAELFILNDKPTEIFTGPHTLQINFNKKPGGTIISINYF